MTHFLTKGRAIPAALALSALLLTGACGKKKVDELPPAPGYGQGSGGAGTYDPYAQGGNGGAVDPNAGYGQGGYGTTGTGGVDTGPGSQADFMRSAQSDRIFFDTDRYNVDSADAVVLQSQAQWAMRNPNTMLVIEGHADERGTRDYNLALAERRANAAKQYLVSLGVPAGRIQTVSYGKERPQAMGSDDASWAQNRRAVTVTVK